MIPSQPPTITPPPTSRPDSSQLPGAPAMPVFPGLPSAIPTNTPSLTNPAKTAEPSDDDIPSVALPPPRSLKANQNTVGQPTEVLPKPRELPRDVTDPLGPSDVPPPKKLDGTTNGDVTRAEVLLGAARNDAKQGNYDAAITKYEQFLKLKSDNEVLAEFGGVLFQADRLADATKIFEELVRRVPAKARDYLIILSDLAVRGGDNGLAISRLYEVLALASDEKLAGARVVRLNAAARLAQVYLVELQFPKACEIYNKYFSGLKPDDPDLPSRFVGLLLDLERPKVAVQFLPPLLERDAESPELLANQVRANAMLGDRFKTLQALEQLQTKAPRDIDARMSLASSLMDIEEYDVANAVFSQLVVVRPNYPPAQILQAELFVRTFRLTQARMTLDGVKPVGLPQEREWMLTRAGYHEAAGEFTQAQLLYAELLRRDPFDYKSRVKLGELYSGTKELEKAKAEFSKVPPTTRYWRTAKRGFAGVLTQQRKFDQAIDTMDETLRDAPWDPQTVAAYVRILSRSGSAGRAFEVASGYLQAGSPYPTAEATVRAAFGRVLYDAGKPLDADQQFAAALAASYRKSPLAIYGLTRMLHQYGGPLQFPPPALAQQPIDELRYRLLLCDFYTDDHDDQHALEFAMGAMRIDPQNIAAMVRVADAYQRISRQTGKIDDAVHACKAVLACSPANSRALITLARAYAIGQKYPAAAETYQRLASLDVEASLPKRELARVYYADHQYELSHQAYLSTGTPDPASAFRQSLQTIATRVPQGKLALEGIALGKLPPEQLRGEVEKLATNVQDPLLAAGLRAAASDYEARVAEVRGAELEDRAKSAKGLRDLTAIGLYKDLLNCEADNTEGLFDLGQIYSSRLMTKSAITTYSDLLAVDPMNREAMIASQRELADASPTLRTWINYEDEAGRNGLATMDRLRVGGLWTVPLGDENEFFGIGYQRVRYTPANDQGLSGNIPSMVYQERLPFYDQMLFRSVINFEQYPNRVQDRPTFDIGFVRYGDAYRADAAIFLENVIANSESLRQDIYRYGARMGGDYIINRRMDIGGLFRYAYYSDENNMAELNIHGGYTLMFAPKQLRALLNINNLFYSQQTVFGPLTPFNQNALFGTIHPYFAPQAFSYYEAKLDWTEQLGRDSFSHSNQCYYNLQAGLGFDTEANTYGVIGGRFNYDIHAWLTVGVEGRYTYSPVYQFGSIMAYLVWRMPELPHF